MKLYVAGAYAAGFHKKGALFNRLTENEKWQRCQVRHILESYHYVYRQSAVDRIRGDGIRVFLDSGAFSAFTMGVDVDMQAYCKYVQENEDIIEKVDDAICASVLDGIGDPLKTYQNQLAMEKLGVRPLPCFHYGEDERYLEYYMANYSYITIGGMVPISTPQLYLWLDRIWDRYLTDGSGRPRLRVHGFGLTTMGLVERYPWYSVDSSSWVQVARNGGMMLYPEAKVISVSNQSPSRKVENMHIDSLNPTMRAAVEERLLQMGVDLKRMREIYLSRWAYNIWTFGLLGDLYEKTHESRFKREQQELFDA
jgi:hypothetical protein